MAGKQAKILSKADFKLLLRLADQTRHPLRNRVIVLLSAKAGLRAGEIAALTWDMLVDAEGRVDRVIELRDAAAKKGSGRRISVRRIADLQSARRTLRSLVVSGLRSPCLEWAEYSVALLSHIPRLHHRLKIGAP